MPLTSLLSVENGELYLYLYFNGTSVSEIDMANNIQDRRKRKGKLQKEKEKARQNSRFFDEAVLAAYNGLDTFRDNAHEALYSRETGAPKLDDVIANLKANTKVLAKRKIDLIIQKRNGIDDPVTEKNVDKEIKAIQTLFHHFKNDYHILSHEVRAHNAIDSRVGKFNQTDTLPDPEKLYFDSVRDLQNPNIESPTVVTRNDYNQLHEIDTYGKKKGGFSLRSRRALDEDSYARAKQLLQEKEPIIQKLLARQNELVYKQISAKYTVKGNQIGKLDKGDAKKLKDDAKELAKLNKEINKFKKTYEGIYKNSIKTEEGNKRENYDPHSPKSHIESWHEFRDRMESENKGPDASISAASLGATSPSHPQNSNLDTGAAMSAAQNAAIEATSAVGQVTSQAANDAGSYNFVHFKDSNGHNHYAYEDSKGDVRIYKYNVVDGRYVQASTEVKPNDSAYKDLLQAYEDTPKGPAPK